MKGQMEIAFDGSRLVADREALIALGKGIVIGDLEIKPGQKPERFRLGRSAALPGEGSWCVFYGDCCSDDYQLIAGFLGKKEAPRLLEKCQELARRLSVPRLEKSPVI